MGSHPEPYRAERRNVTFLTHPEAGASFVAADVSPASSGWVLTRSRSDEPPPSLVSARWPSAHEGDRGKEVHGHGLTRSSSLTMCVRADTGGTRFPTSVHFLGLRLLVLQLWRSVL